MGRSHPTHCVVLVLSFVLVAARASAASNGAERGYRGRSPAIKAAYLVQFARYVWWPVDRQGKGRARLDRVHILVVGAPQVRDQLAHLERKENLAVRPVVRYVARIAALSAADVAWSHIVYTPDPAIARLLTAAHPDRPILLVTDGRGSTRSGAAIAFYLSANKVRLEIAPRNASSRGLELSSRLLRVAGAISRHTGETSR